MGWIIEIIIGLWFLFSIKKVGPKEMAVWVRLGRPVDSKGSGIYFVPFLISKLIRFPKKTYNFLYKDREVISQATEDIGSQVLKVDLGVYLNFPRKERKNNVRMTKEELEAERVQGNKDEGRHPLVKILEGGIPTEEEALKTWAEEAIGGIVRAAIGRHSWLDAVENQDPLQKEISEKLKQPDSPLIKAGFSPEGIKFILARIELPSEIKKSLGQVDAERLRARAAEFTTKAEAKEREFLGEALSELTQKLVASGYAVEDAQKKAFETLQDYLAATKNGNFQKIIWRGSSSIAELAAQWELGKRMPIGSQPRPQEEKDSTGENKRTKVKMGGEVYEIEKDRDGKISFV